jgi:hypothetical protein
MNQLTRMAIASDDASYMEGAEDGFWRGYFEGAHAATMCIMGYKGAKEPNKIIPAEFHPLGTRYFAHDFSKDR